MPFDGDQWLECASPVDEDMKRALIKARTLIESGWTQFTFHRVDGPCFRRRHSYCAAGALMHATLSDSDYHRARDVLERYLPESSPGLVDVQRSSGHDQS